MPSAVSSASPLDRRRSRAYSRIVSCSASSCTSLIPSIWAACVLAPRGSIGVQPQGDVGWLHRLPNHPY